MVLVPLKRQGLCEMLTIFVSQSKELCHIALEAFLEAANSGYREPGGSGVHISALTGASESYESHAMW